MRRISLNLLNSNYTEFSRATPLMPNNVKSAKTVILAGCVEQLLVMMFPVQHVLVYAVPGADS